MLKATYLQIAVLILLSHTGSLLAQQNILLIFMEDLGLQIGPYGDKTAPTPAMDRLAEQSLLFENAYCVQATCSPSRSSFYSSQYPHQTGHMGLAGNYGYYMKPGFKTFLNVLKSKSYYTGFSYKIHVNPESQIRKDYDKAYDNRHMKKDNVDSKDSVKNIEYFDEFMTERPKDQPFFYMAQIHDTHEPFVRGKFKGAPKMAPYKTLGKPDVKPLASFGKDIKFEGYLNQHVANYYNAIQRADFFVDGILKTLEQHGCNKNTVVILSSDHGPSFARGKLSNNELGLRVPMMIHWPNSKANGQRRNELVNLMDLAPTFIDIAGGDIPKQYEGRSLAPMAKGENLDTPWRTEHFAEYTSHTTVDYWPMRSVRDARYKIIKNMLVGTEHESFFLAGGRVQKEGFSPDHDMGMKSSPDSVAYRIYSGINNPPAYELYDLANDPYETSNLAENPEYAKVLDRMKDSVVQWQRETEDPFLNDEYFKTFTEAQKKKQDEIRAWEKMNGKNAFWGKKVAKGDWKELMD